MREEGGGTPEAVRPMTVLADGRISEVDARIAREPSSAAGEMVESVRLSAEALARTLGFELKPEGLCKGELCLPTGSRAGLVTEDGVDLVALADLLERPLALDLDEGVVLVGESARRRSDQLRSLEAPEFRLPDLDGREHALADYRGRKVFLLAFASW